MHETGCGQSFQLEKIHGMIGRFFGLPDVVSRLPETCRGERDHRLLAHGVEVVNILVVQLPVDGRISRGGVHYGVWQVHNRAMVVKTPFCRLRWTVVGPQPGSECAGLLLRATWFAFLPVISYGAWCQLC